MVPRNDIIEHEELIVATTKPNVFTTKSLDLEGWRSGVGRKYPLKFAKATKYV